MNWLNAFGETVQTRPEALNGFGVAKDTELTKPSAFQGTGEALQKTLPFQFYQTVSGFNELLADRVEVNYDLDNNEDAFSDFEPTQDQKEQVANKLRQDAKFARLKAQNDYTPNPETTGQAAMMIHGLTGSLAKAVVYTVLTGGSGILAAPLFGADLGLYEAGKLRDKGVDESTARKAGAITGAVNAVGMALPGAVGTSYLKSMAFGGGVNLVTDMGEQAAIKFILENANYTKQAQEYDPFDPVNLGVSAGMGIAFGALGARANRAQARYLEAESKAAEQTEPQPQDQAAPNTNMNKSVLDSIQNRDRTSKESRLQMEKIAAAPNFNLLRESRSLDQGAPIIAYVPDDMNVLWGKSVEVSADPNSKPMTMRYAVVDADDVFTSNAVDGSSNPKFTDPTVAGARAIAGNGRIAGLQGAYKQVKATNYRADLTKDAKEFGISKRQIKKMKSPILVRIMDDADVVEGIGEASNRTGTLKLNPAEQAAQDARNVRLEEVEFTKDGGITRKSMDEFVRRTPDKEGLIDSNGNALYDNIARRMRPAIFAAAFSDTRIINRFIADSPEDRKIMNVLQSVAAEVVRLKKIKGELGFSPDLLEAVADVFETRREAKKINGKGHESELTGSLMEESATPAQRYFRDILLSSNPERLQDVLARFREVAEQESGGEGFSGSVTKDQVFDTVKSEFDQQEAAVNSIQPSHLDAAMELQHASVIQNDQPVGKRGDVNKSIADEKKAAEQIDNGERVEVSGEGVDPEVMDQQVSDFITRFVKQLVGAGAEKKVAEMGAKVHDAFFETLGIRLGKNRKELEQEYALRVERAESAEGFAQEPASAAEKLRKEAEDWGRFVDDLKVKPNQNVVMLKQTPLVMKLIGAKFLTLRATPHMFDGALPGKKSSPSHHIHPEISKRVLKQIPEALTDPIAIFRDDRRESTYLFMLDLKAENNQNVVVAVKFNDPGRHAEINLAKTSWGPDKTLYFPLQEQNNAVVYANKEKISRWNKSSGIYSLRGSNDSGVSVKTEADLVKLRELFPGYYQTSIQDPLITVHNISEENLNKSLDLGGFAVPSLGITKQRTPYEGFGEITLIGTRDMIDPEKGTPVFSQDIYSKMFPDIVLQEGKPFVEIDGSLKPLTLENAVLAMTSGPIKNQGGGSFSMGNIGASTAKRFKNLKEIQADREKVTDSDTVSYQTMLMDSRITNFKYDASQIPGADMDARLKAQETVVQDLAKVVANDGEITEARVREALSGYNSSDDVVRQGVDILNRIKESVTDYFEAKPQRAVGADEFRGAVVPDGTSEATIKRLEKAGITVAKYDAEVEGARERVIRDLTNRLNEKRGDILFQNENAPRGIYTPGERVITLMQSANESTFIHESGHYFLDVLTDVAMKENAPAQVKADVQTLMTWFGVKDLDEWRSLSIDEQRAAHEQFARGFEQYLREGEAPSSALEKVFEAFKDWLTKIYKSSEELQVEISPEVRAAYDRLLATDEQIRTKQEAEAPAFDFGMKPEEPTNPAVKTLQQTAEQMIDAAPIPEEGKTKIKETLGINQTEQQTGENHPRHKVMSDDEFVDNEFQKVLEDQPGLKIYDENGKEIDVASFMETTNQKAQELRRTANSMGEAALCMWNQGGLGDL